MQTTTIILTIRREVSGLNSDQEAQSQRDSWERYLQTQGWSVDGKELYTEKIDA